MNIEVRYYTKSGNTEKLAKAIANAVGVEAKTIDVPISEKADILFLGSSVYAAGIDETIKHFISGLDSDSVGKVVNFSTAALLSSTYKQVKQLVENQGITMDEKEYHCRGSFYFMHKNRPDEKDLKAVREFAKEIVGK